MKEKKQRSMNDILFNTPHGYYKIKGMTYTEIKETEEKEQRRKK